MRLPLLILLVSAPAHAEGVTDPPPADRNLDAFADHDAAVAQVGFLPGGWIDPAGSIAANVDLGALTLVRAASVRGAVIDRVELSVVAAENHIPEISRESHGFASARAEVRVAITRSPRESLVVRVQGGALRELQTVERPWDLNTSLGAVGVGATTCVGRACEVIADARFLVGRTAGDGEPWYAGGAGVVIGDGDLRAVVDVDAASWDSGLPTYGYLGLRYARRHVAIDAGVAFPEIPLPAPGIALTLRR